MSYFRRYPTLTPELSKQISELKETQQTLRSQTKIESILQPIQYVAGCDSAFIGEKILSVFVVFTYPELEEVELQYHLGPVELPYIPGYLAFREAPNLVKAYQKLSVIPDIIMVDGHGILHPRRMGIATHLGVLLQRPTFGVAKKKLVGKYEEPSNVKGSATFVTDHEETVGVALRSKENVKSIFVSAGHLCTLDDALQATLATLRSHKLPEPTYFADKYSKTLKEEAVANDSLA